MAGWEREGVMDNTGDVTSALSLLVYVLWWKVPALKRILIPLILLTNVTKTGLRRRSETQESPPSQKIDAALRSHWHREARGR